MVRLLGIVLLAIAQSAAAITFTTHFPTKIKADFVALTPSSRIVYVLWQRTLFRSDDGGVTFTPRINYDYVDNLIVDPVNPDILYHWDPEDIRRSVDGGTSWQQAAFPLPPSMSSLIVDPQHPATLLLSSRCNASRKGGVYRSDDRGDHWTQIISGQCVATIALDPVTGEIYTYTGEAPADGRIVPAYQVVVDPRTPQVRYGIGFDVQAPQGPSRVVVTTTDNGKNWQRMQLPGVEGNIGNLALDPVNGRLFLSTSTGVYVGASDGRWSLIAGAPQTNGAVYADSASLYVLSGGKLFRAPLTTLEPFDVRGVVAPIPITSLAYDANAHVLFAAGQGVWRSRDSGRHWEPITADDGVWRNAIAVDAAGDVYVIASHVPYQDSDVLRYTAATGEWNGAGKVPYASSPVLVAHPTRRGVLFASADFWHNPAAGLKSVAGLYVTDDAGDHWRPAVAIDSTAAGIAIHPERPDVIHVVTPDGVFISRDAGVRWTRTSLVHPSWIAIAPSDPSRLYADYIGLLRSDDGGTTWQSLNLPNGGNQVLGVDPMDADSVWAIGETVMHSTNGGRTWRTEASNFPAAHYPFLLFFEPDGAHMHLALSPSSSDPLGACEWDATLRGVDDGSDGHHRAARH